jgi:hypothetical protein
MPVRPTQPSARPFLDQQQPLGGHSGGAPAGHRDAGAGADDGRLVRQETMEGVVAPATGGAICPLLPFQLI